MSDCHSPPRATWVEALAALLVVGYLSMGRTFAYVGVPPVFIGDLSLAAMLVFRFRGTMGRWLYGLMRPGPLSGFAWMLGIWGVYGGIQTVRGLVNEPFSTVTLQNSIIHIYPWYFLVGLYIGARNPRFLSRVIWWLACWMCVYGVAYLLVLGRLYPVELTYEYRPPTWIGLPTGGASTALLGLLCFEPRLLRLWLPVLLNTFVMLGMQMRAEWLSFSAAVGLWGLCLGRLRHVALLAGMIAGLLLIGDLVDFKMPSSGGRGGEFSARGMIARVLSAVDEKAAAALSPHAADHAATAQWRTDWWNGIWRMVHKDEPTMLFGPSYGFVLASLHPEDLSGGPQRTPHSIFMFILGYTGWIGVVLFCLLHWTLAVLLYRVYRNTGQPFGVCLLCQMLVWGFFDTHIETPFAAIPAYLLLGVAAAPCLEHEQARSAGQHDKKSRNDASVSRSTDT